MRGSAASWARVECMVVGGLYAWLSQRWTAALVQPGGGLFTPRVHPDLRQLVAQEGWARWTPRHQIRCSAGARTARTTKDDGLLIRPALTYGGRGLSRGTWCLQRKEVLSILP